MNLLVLDSFFVNLCILCTGLLIFHVFFRKVGSKLKPGLLKVFIGIAAGLFGVLLMRFGIPLPGGTLIDLRIIPMMVAAQVAGPISPLLAAGVIICARLSFYPHSTAAFVNVGVLLVAGSGFSVVARSSVKRSYKWSVMALIFVVTMGSCIGFVIDDWKRAFVIFVQYAVSVAAATYFTQALLSYLWRSREAFNRLKDMAETDHLTGLQNTRSFEAEIRDAYLRAESNQEPLSLLSMDIDYFKQVNDTYGHPAGDEVLRQIARILQNNCRSLDVVCRNGGEEFAVILPACNRVLAGHVAERIRTAVAEHTFVLSETTAIQLTVSIGLATVTRYNWASLDELIHSTDEGLYMAKRSGRNRICREGA